MLQHGPPFFFFSFWHQVNWNSTGFCRLFHKYIANVVCCRNAEGEIQADFHAFKFVCCIGVTLPLVKREALLYWELNLGHT